MSSLFGWGADPFGELVDKATSELLPAAQEDIALNLEICDQIRAKQVQPKQAMQALKRRISHKNPNVVLLALGLTDICIKNGGDHFVTEVASREFMDNLVSVLRNPAGVNVDVKTKALKLIQNWAQISEAKPLQMMYIKETFRSLRSSGFDFPPPDSSLVAGKAFVETMTAPEWTDSEVCMRCRTAFTTFNRKHHCRNCGQVFCQDCSSKSMALPWYGVGQDVRVCEACFSKKAPAKQASSTSGGENGLGRSKSAHVFPTGRGGAGSHHRSNTLGSSSTGKGERTSRRKKEEDDLALAIKLSLESSGEAGPSRPGYAASASVKEGRPTRQSDGRMMEGTDADDDPDLAAAIAASLREYAPPAPSAPMDDGRQTPRLNDYRNGVAANRDTQYQQQESKLPLPPSLELPTSDIDALLTFAQDASNQESYARQFGHWQQSYGARQQTQDAYERACGARPRMAKTLDEATRRQGVLTSMHDKLTEAVRLYDRILDAQMHRPAQAMYGGQPEPYRYASYPLQQSQQWSPQQYHRYAADSSGPQASAPAPEAQRAGSEMYPSLPSQYQQPAQYRAPDYQNQDPTQSQQMYVPAESPSPYPHHQPQYAERREYAYFTQPQGYGMAPQDYNASPGFAGTHPVDARGVQQQQQQQQQAPIDSMPTGQSVASAQSMGQIQSVNEIHSPSSRQTSYSQAQPLNQSMANMGLQSQTASAPTADAEAHPSAPYATHPSYESEGWRGIPITQSSSISSPALERSSLRHGGQAPTAAEQSQTSIAQAQLASLPSPGKLPSLTSPRVGHVDASASAAAYAMPPPPPQGFPGLSSPVHQQNNHAWNRPVETPLIDL